MFAIHNHINKDKKYDPKLNKHGNVTLGSPDQNCLSFLKEHFS